MRTKTKVTGITRIVNYQGTTMIKRTSTATEDTTPTATRIWMKIIKDEITSRDTTETKEERYKNIESAVETRKSGTINICTIVIAGTLKTTKEKERGTGTKQKSATATTKVERQNVAGDERYRQRQH